MTAAAEASSGLVLALDQVAPAAVLEASAGTGKTYQLEQLVLALVREGRAHLDEILVVTFTERAASELGVRIRRVLDDAWHAATTGAGPPPEAAATLRLLQARQALDRATIATIHGFCQGVLIDEPLATRRLLAQTAVDGAVVFGEVFRDVLRRTLATDPGHRAYLEAYLDAGGSAARLEALLYKAYKASKARGRWATVYDESLLDTLARVLPTFADAELKKAMEDAKAHHSSVIALPRRMGPLRDAAAQSLKHPTRCALVAAMPDRDPNFFKYLDLLAECAAAGRTRTLAAALLAMPTLNEVVAQRFLPAVERELQQRKLGQGLYDFDDMIASVAEALDGPFGAELCAKLRARYRYALVDEAQDTEPAQWQIFRRVFLESEGRNPVVLIGDPKQAIYRFRGADVRTYVAARAEIEARGGRVVPLAQNRRSVPGVVAGYNAILDQSATSPYFTDPAIRYDHPVTAVRAAPEDAAGPRPGVTLLTMQPGGRVRMVEVRHALRRAIREQLVRLTRAQPTLRLSRVFVLTRTNVEALEVGAALRDAGIPLAYYKLDYLFATSEAEHVRALLRAIDDPNDRAARTQAWLTPFFDLPLEELAASAAPRPEHPLLARLWSWKALAEARDYAALWPRVLDESGVARRLRLSPSGQRRLANYRHLFDLLLAEVAARPASPRELGDALGSFAAGMRRPSATTGAAGADDTGVQRIETEAEAVQIMTMHKAKGLEADHVFVYGALSQRAWWGDISTFDEDDERLICAGAPRRARRRQAITDGDTFEDQRLLYVAMTRARERLYLPFFPNAATVERELKQDSDDFELFTKLSGPFRHVNRRLQTLMQDPAAASLFETVAVPCPAPPEDATVDLAAALQAWIPPATLTTAPAPPTDVAGLRARRAGFFVTSYTRLKEAQGGYLPPNSAGGYLPPSSADGYLPPNSTDGYLPPNSAGGYLPPNSTDRPLPPPSADDESPLLDPIEQLDVAGALGDAGGTTDSDDARQSDGGELPALPGGAASGLFLHAVLEKAALGTLAPLATWQRQPDVLALLQAELLRWDREPRHLAAAAALVHAALTTPIAFPDGAVLPGIARAGRVRREVDFLFPWPSGAPFGSAMPEDRLAREPGFVRGILDVVFEHEGRVYLADWKSDVLPAFGADALGTHVAANYELQLRLYTLALVRMLGIGDEAAYQRRFGGFVYVFLRGLGHAGEGLHVGRPPYADVRRWDAELAAMHLGASGVEA